MLRSRGVPGFEGSRIHRCRASGKAFLASVGHEPVYFETFVPNVSVVDQSWTIASYETNRQTRRKAYRASGEAAAGFLCKSAIFSSQPDTV